MGGAQSSSLFSKMTALANACRARFNTKDKLGIDDMIKLITPPKQIVLVPAGSLKGLYANVDATRETYTEVIAGGKKTWYLDHDTYISYKSMKNAEKAFDLIKNGQQFTMEVDFSLPKDWGNPNQQAPLNYWTYGNPTGKKSMTCKPENAYSFSLPVNNKVVKTVKDLSVVCHPDFRNFLIDLASVSVTLVAK